MANQNAFRLRNPLLLMALAAAYPVLSYGAGPANIDFAAGSVTAVNVAGVQRPLTKGAEISNGDTIRTGDGGRAQLRFSDGAMVSLQPQTEFRIDNYHYANRSDGSEKGFFSLLKGGMRALTGLIGRSNRDNYKVTTSVATIGIRGTEYTGIIDPVSGQLMVNTGEGVVEVCNAAGCVLLASGESGIVSGGDSAPRRTASRPLLPPAPPNDSVLPVFSASENRDANGLVLRPSSPSLPLSTPLVSGSGFAVAFASAFPFATVSVAGPGAATFDAASELQSFSDGFNDFTKVSSAGSFAVDGVIGWGRWSSGTSNSGSLADFHYVTGTLTPNADITALGGLTATYNLIGFTLPTATDGTVGQAPSGSLVANFVGGVAGLSLNMSVPIGGSTYSLSGTGSSFGPGNPTFSLFGSVAGAGPSGSFFSANGFFAGANASHAGLAYGFDSISPLGQVSGAAAFKR